MISVLLPRPRLLDSLDRSDRPLTVLSAPSGFGKTSLVRGWVETLDPAQVRVIWVALGTEVVTRSGFWETVLTSAGRLGVVPVADVPRLMEEVERTADPAGVLAGCLVQGARVVLVVDAYERLQDITAQVDEDIVRLTELLPRVQAVLTTRTGSGLAGPGRSLRDGVRLLTETDLAFTEAETQGLVDAFATPETADALGAEGAAAELHRVTRGYPLALRAVLLALARTGVMPDRAERWQAMVAEDLRVQLGEGPAYEFVLTTCVPPYFDADLARDVTGRSDVKETLDDLEWNGFGRWIPFAAGRQVFQYVDSLREAMLADGSERAVAARARGVEAAATWLHRNGDHEMAFELAVGAGLYGIAARVYSKLVVGNQDAVASDRFDRHLATIPSRALTQYPSLAMGRGLACHRDPALRGAAAEYFKIPAAWTGPRFDDLSPGEVLLGHVSKVISLRLLGRFQESGRAATQAIAFHDSMTNGSQEQLADLQPMALRHVAYSQLQAGEVEAARATAARALAMTTEPRSRNYTAVYVVGFDALDGRVAEARAAQRWIDESAWRPRQTQSYVNALGRIGQATLLLDEFDFDGAVAEYDDCEAFRHTSEFWPFITWTLMHARLGLGQAAAEARRVEDALARNPTPPGMTDSLGSAAVHGALAVLWIAAGNRGQAVPHLRQRTRYGGQLAPAVLLARLVAGDPAGALGRLPGLEARGGHTTRSSAATLVLAAAAALRVGNEATAVALLERVLARVGPGGARAHLAYLPAGDLDALRRLASGIADEALAAYLSGPVPAIRATEAGSVPLTPQELVVVTTFLDHPTRAGVAAALHVSENTVKTHLQRIYRKLGVSSRDSLVERVIELDLLVRR